MSHYITQALRQVGAHIPVSVFETLHNATFTIMLFCVCTHTSLHHASPCTQVYESQSGRLYLVFEFVPITLYTLMKQLRESGRGLMLPEAKDVMWQLLLAVDFLHKKKVRVRA
jgi:serine/threonine protein kinase